MPAQRKVLANVVVTQANPVAMLVADVPDEDEARRRIFDRIKQEGEILAQHAMGVAGHAQNNWQHYGPPDAEALARDIAVFETHALALHQFMRAFHAAAVARNRNPPDGNPDTTPRRPAPAQHDDEPPF